MIYSIDQREEHKIRLSTLIPERKDRCLRSWRNDLPWANQQGTAWLDSRFQDTVIGYTSFINLMLFLVCGTN